MSLGLAAEPADHPPTTKVDITVAGHTVIVESADPLDMVASKALELFRATEASADRSPVGFATTAGSFERAEPADDEDLDPVEAARQP